jgi:hypothetical protein
MIDEKQFLFEEAFETGSRSKGFTPTLEWMEENYDYYADDHPETSAIFNKFNLPGCTPVAGKGEVGARTVRKWKNSKIFPVSLSIGFDTSSDNTVAFVSNTMLDGMMCPTSLCFTPNFQFTSEDKARVTLLHEMGHAAITSSYKDDAKGYMAMNDKYSSLQGHHPEWVEICQKLEKATGLAGIAKRYADDSKVRTAGELGDQHGNVVTNILIRYTTRGGQEAVQIFRAKEFLSDPLVISTVVNIGRPTAKAKGPKAASYYLIDGPNATEVMKLASSLKPGVEYNETTKEYGMILDMLFGGSEDHSMKTTDTNSVMKKNERYYQELNWSDFKEYYADAIAEVS